jgi:hypothetical protein
MKALKLVGLNLVSYLKSIKIVFMLLMTLSLPLWAYSFLALKFINSSFVFLSGAILILAVFLLAFFSVYKALDFKTKKFYLDNLISAHI